MAVWEAGGGLQAARGWPEGVWRRSFCFSRKRKGKGEGGRNMKEKEPIRTAIVRACGQNLRTPLIQKYIFKIHKSRLRLQK